MGRALGRASPSRMLPQPARGSALAHDRGLAESPPAQAESHRLCLSHSVPCMHSAVHLEDAETFRASSLRLGAANGCAAPRRLVARSLLIRSRACVAPCRSGELRPGGSAWFMLSCRHSAIDNPLPMLYAVVRQRGATRSLAAAWCAPRPWFGSRRPLSRPLFGEVVWRGCEASCRRLARRGRTA